MHGRRYFTKALDAGDSRDALPLAAWKKLYEVEEEVRGREAAVVDDGQRHRLPARQRDGADALPRGRAHPHRQRSVERPHVRTALTRKNFLFAGSNAGGERAAIAYTVLGCCALADLNPVEYLADVLPRLSRRARLKDVPAFMPTA